MRAERSHTLAAAGATLLLSIAAAMLVLVGGARAAGGCTDNWTNASGGAWNVAANWDHGVPAASDDVCVTLPGSYTVILAGAPSSIHSLTVGVASGTTEQTLEIQGTPGLDAILELAADSTITANGQLDFDSQAGGGLAAIEPADGTTPTITSSGSVIATAEGGNSDYMDVAFDNASPGTVEVESGALVQAWPTVTTNAGKITVNSGAALEITNSGGSLDNQGPIVDSGSLELSGGASWTQSAGTLSGNAVKIESGALVDDAGTGAFTLTDAVKLSGTIPVGQTVTVESNADVNSSVELLTDVTNDGTLALVTDPSASGPYIDSATETTRTLNNSGLLLATGNAGAEVDKDYLEVYLENASDGTIEVSAGQLAQDLDTTTTNDGTVILDTSASYQLVGGGGSFTNEADGTIEFAIGSASAFGSFTITPGATLDLAGTADPALTGGYAPPAGQEFDVASGPSSGTFATVANGFTADYANAGVVGLVAPAAPPPPPPTVTHQPANTSIVAGQAATFTAAASGASSVQWQVASAPAGRFTNVAAATSDTLTLNAVTLAQTGNRYRAVFTNGGGSTNSAVATLTVSAAPQAPVNATAPAISQNAQGGALEASTGAWSGTPTPGYGYQWLRCDGAGNGCAPIPGATASAYAPTAADQGHALRVRVTASNSAGSRQATSAAVPIAAKPATPASPASPAGTTGAAAGSTTAGSGTTAAGPGTTSPPPGAAASVAAPILGHTANASPVNGTVLIRLPGSSRFTPLRATDDVPLGSTIDARSGRVSLTVALPNGFETGQFYDGEFVVTQSPNGTLIATLAGGSFAGCAGAARSVRGRGGARLAAAHKKPPTVVRQLWGNAHGDYTTKGRYGSASVSGTIWLTQDRCDGTFVRVTRDDVIVVAYAHPHRRRNIRQGHQILIPAPPR